jgi:hypothetical protein
MAKTNLLVKFTTTIPFHVIRPILKIKRVPMLALDQIRLNSLKSFVMSHEIIKSVNDQETPMAPWCFVLLHRDLDMFCEGLANFQYMIKQHDELVSHIITLVEPFQDGPPTSELYSQKFQEMLIAPYRAKLRGFPRFTIQGAISENLAAAAMAQITRSRMEDPGLVLSDLEELKTKGNDSFRTGDKRMASEHWSRALLNINRLMNSSSGEKLREAGGPGFVNRMMALYFDLCSNRAQNYINTMRENLSDRNPVRSYGEGFFNSIDGTRDSEIHSILFPGTTWTPSQQQMAKVLYREAVGCRLIGDAQFVGQAESAIERAVTLVPGDAELEREKDRISQWKRRVTG